MVDHHYSRTDLAALVGGLDRAGLPFIEVGHGNGVGSQLFRDPKLRGTSFPIVDDAGHAQVALRVAERAKVGVVLTAGRRFAPPEYIDRIADLGFAFVRLAVMPDEVDDELFAYVRKIKSRGMLASINMMQTYVKTPAEVGELAARAAGHGVDWWYVVDSAGGMMVDDVKRYVAAVLEAARVEVGLHAHNNLGCAVANCLAAVAAGATLVDGTLNGMGRATGNPATEQLAVALRDRLQPAVDLDLLVALGNAVRSLFDGAGNDPFDFISGGALVHSRNVPKVFDAARARGRARSSFLIAVGTEAQRRGVLNAMQYTDELYDTAAAVATPADRAGPSDAMIGIASEEFLARWRGGPRRAIDDLFHASRQRHVPSVVHVSRAAAAFGEHAVPWHGAAMGVTVPWTGTTPWDLAADRLPDYVLVDEGDPEPPLTATIATFRISFDAIYARAVEDLRSALGDRAALLGADGADDTRIATGQTAIVAAPIARARIEALQRRGVRVVEPRWPQAVAQVAESLIALRRDLAITGSRELVAGIDARGAGQAKWDPEHQTLLDADDPVTAAERAGAAYLGAILGGTRRL